MRMALNTPRMAKSQGISGLLLSTGEGWHLQAIEAFLTSGWQGE